METIAFLSTDVVYDEEIIGHFIRTLGVFFRYVEGVRGGGGGKVKGARGVEG